MRRIAYIPARSGSKGVPQKNIRKLCGKPLLAWMVEAAKKTELFDRIMVSTDSEEYAEIARAYGAWVPFLRDRAVAADTTSTIETICSDKRRLNEMGEVFGTFCLLQATSPLCRGEDICNAVALHERSGEGVVSIVRSMVRLSLLRTISDNGEIFPILSTRKVLRRQDEPACYELNGAIFVNHWDEIDLNLKLAYNPLGYVMDDISSIDVDTLDDFAKAERLLAERLGASS